VVITRRGLPGPHHAGREAQARRQVPRRVSQPHAPLAQIQRRAAALNSLAQRAHPVQLLDYSLIEIPSESRLWSGWVSVGSGLLLLCNGSAGVSLRNRSISALRLACHAARRGALATGVVPF